MNLPRFGVTKPVPANLLMLGLVIAGVVAGTNLTREFFPDVTPDMASITLPYPGATPEEVEEGMARKVEDAIDDLDEVEEYTTTLSEGGGGIMVEFRDGVDIDQAIDEVERAVDALLDLPDEAETIQVVEFLPRMPVIMVTLYGDEDEESLKRSIHRVRDELQSLPDMGEITLSGVREYEVRVDVSYGTLLEHGIGLPEVATAIRAWMSEVPGGSVRTGTGNINVRTMGVEEKADAIRDIVIRATTEGQALRVGDIAEVSEDYVDTRLVRRFNGKKSVSLTVYKVGDQDAVSMAKKVRAYVAGRQARTTDTGFEGTMLEHRFGSDRRTAWELGRNSPEPLVGQLATHSDLARFIEGRLELLTRNALWGAMLVFLTLFLFLNWRVATWVGVGLVTALCGTLLVMAMTDITLNLLTMFGLIVVLGLLVDDAIVVAENIQTRHDRGEPALVAAIKGANEVFWPVVATIITSIVAFIPLGFIRGSIGDLMRALPIVVSVALVMSLIESVIILPSHMGHALKHRDQRKPSRIFGWLHRYEAGRDSLIHNRIVPGFGEFLNVALMYRYVSVAVACAILLATVGLVAGGRVEMTFLSSDDSETIVVDIRMPIGVPIEETDRLARAIEDAALAINGSSAQGERDVESVSAVIGERQNIDTGSTDVSATHVAQVFLELSPIERRTHHSSEIIDIVRSSTKDITQFAESVKFTEISGGPGGDDITLEVQGERLAVVEDAVEDIKRELHKFDGVYGITDDNYAGQRELQISVKPAGAALGFTNENISMQVRGALFGIDAHVFSERREDIDVRVRLAENIRNDLYAIENMWVISPVGNAVPLSEAAEINEGTSYATIRRINGNRAITVTADTAPDTNPEMIMAAFPFANIQAQHPHVQLETGGRQEQMTDAMSTLPIAFAAALLAIYVILAWLFSSFLQPLAVMIGIPFALIGVILGHWILGYQITFLSGIGFVALSGIVVNDSLILVEFYNTRRQEGAGLREALVDAGKRRLRPIFLTTVTTVMGLTPLMLETSFQARFLIPMAIAIAFGLMSATGVILVVLPCLLVVVDDIKRVAYFLWNGRPRPASAKPASASLMDLPD